MDYSAGFIQLWNSSQAILPSGMPVYSTSEKKQREKRFEAFLKVIQEQVKFSGETMNRNKQALLDQLYVFFRDTLDYSDGQLAVILSDEMVRATFQFVNTARTYDPEICFHDIFQACRNVWIMNGVQFLLGRKIEMTPPIFAYSMLYPYTDNYLDNPNIPTIEKIGFSLRFERRLRGEQVAAQNCQEEKIFRMVEIIEEYWDRDCYPEVFESLLAIHGAQTQSLRLISEAGSLGLDEKFSVCIHKGGTSVVADGYLIMGKMTKEEEEFFYYYGAYLQLLDDLQDVGDDFNDRLWTGFSSLAKDEVLDKWLCKTYDLGLKVMSCVDALKTEQGNIFKQLMKKSIDLFLVESVLANKSFFSRKFVRQFEAFSPLRYSFIRKKNSTFSLYQDQLFEQILQHALVDDDRFSYQFLNKKPADHKEQQAV